jgi:hypothetical protein
MAMCTDLTVRTLCFVLGDVMRACQVDGVIRASNAPRFNGYHIPFFETPVGLWSYPWQQFHVAVKPPLPQSPDTMRIIAVPHTVSSGPSASSGSSIPMSKDAAAATSAPGASTTAAMHDL